MWEGSVFWVGFYSRYWSESYGPYLPVRFILSCLHRSQTAHYLHRYEFPWLINSTSHLFYGFGFCCFIKLVEGKGGFTDYGGGSDEIVVRCAFIFLC